MNTAQFYRTSELRSCTPVPLACLLYSFAPTAATATTAATTPGHNSKILAFACATGMVKEQYIPMIGALCKRRVFFEHILLVDNPNHGDSGHRYEFEDWRPLIDDYYLAMTDVFRQKHITTARRLFGYGHSFGGACLASIAIHHPHTFAGLCLHEPIIIVSTNFPSGNPLAAAAAARKDVFPSRQVLWDKWHGNKVFKNWKDDVLRAYIDHAFADTSDGRVQLKLPGKMEAKHFEVAPRQTLMQELAALPPDCKLVITCERGTFHHDNFAIQQRYLRKGSYQQHVVRDGLTHFLPFEDPDEVSFGAPAKRSMR